MQWRKASEVLPLPNKVYFCRSENGGMFADRYYVNGWKTELEYPGEVSPVKLWLDETPTTQAVWPGEDEIEAELVEIRNVRKLPLDYYLGFQAAINWLKSHTAPKAEEPHRSEVELTDDLWDKHSESLPEDIHAALQMWQAM